jgi:hypothetical protein
MEEILREGTILLIKELYLKLISNRDYGIYINHLSNIIYLPAYNKRALNS